MFIKPLVYDELEPNLDILQDAFEENLEVSSNGKSIGLSLLSPKLRLLTTIMFHNLYPLSSTEHMNLGQALFLHDLITDEEIDVCSHISTLNAIIGHSQKNAKQESNAPQGDTSSSSHFYDEKLDNIMPLCKTLAQNCPASQLSCTLSTPDLRQSLPLSKLNWIKYKGS